MKGVSGFFMELNLVELDFIGFFFEFARGFLWVISKVQSFGANKYYLIGPEGCCPFIHPNWLMGCSQRLL